MPSSNTFATSGLDLVGHCIDNGRLRFLSVLGVGAYGVVYLAVDLHAPKPVYLAVKCLLRAGLDNRQRHFQRREIALHGLASKHPNVVTMHKVFEEGDYVFVVMDFCDEGDLFGMITERQRYIGNDALIRKVFLQIVDAVEYCHSMGIFHRDLKPENILCTRDGERICIADFGLATSEKQSTDFGCGSTFYLSPECQGGLFERLESYSTELNDIWSLGVILVNLTCGRNPWRQACPSDETFRAYVHDPNFLRTILPISEETNCILKGLFALEPKHRPTLRELRHAILRVPTFTMTDEELMYAHPAARAAAAAVRTVPPPAPAPVAVPASTPVPAVAVPQQPVAVPTAAVPKPLAVHVVNVDEEDDFVPTGPIAPRPIVWSSGSSAFSDLADAQMEEDIFDFSPRSHRAGVPLPQVGHHTKQAPTSAAGAGAYPTPAGTPLLVETDPYTMGRTSSNSSSSGGLSCPPTPEFDPADRHACQVPAVPRWEFGVKGGVNRPEMLGVSPVSPTCDHFAL